MFGNFQEEARKVLLLARSEMSMLKHPYVGSEHLLLAILKTKNNVSKKLKNYNSACDLTKISVQKVANYFETVNKYKDAPVNSFTFSSCNDAAVKGLIKQNKEIMEGAEKDSVIAALCHNIELLYGDKHAHRTDMGISESESFTHLEHSVEIPLLSFLNPISEIFKATEIRKEIINLREEVANAK